MSCLRPEGFTAVRLEDAVTDGNGGAVLADGANSGLCWKLGPEKPLGELFHAGT
jgi:hypothetical protein